MTDILLVGSGGCMRELVWQIIESNKILPEWNIVGYVDKRDTATSHNLSCAGIEIPYWGDDDDLLQCKTEVNVVVAIGNSETREKVVRKYLSNPKIKFPNMILQHARVSKDVQMGQGCIISMDAKVSTNVKLGSFVFINIGGIICHDGLIEDFVSINPKATLAGAVKVQKGTEIGMGANVIQGTTIGQNVVVGAGSVIIRDVDSHCTIVGVPGRKL